MAEQTAVKMLINHIRKHGYDIEYEMEMSFLDHEKDQIELAYKNGANDEFEHWMNNEERKTSIGYYKRAYKK